jgi:hypothetical protein
VRELYSIVLAVSAIAGPICASGQSLKWELPVPAISAAYEYVSFAGQIGDGTGRSAWLAEYGKEGRGVGWAVFLVSKNGQIVFTHEIPLPGASINLLTIRGGALYVRVETTTSAPGVTPPTVRNVVRQLSLVNGTVVAADVDIGENATILSIPHDGGVDALGFFLTREGGFPSSWLAIQRYKF